MHVHNQVGADRGKELVPWVRRIQKNMSNAWYRKYAGMLFPKLKECVRRMITGALNMLIFVVLLMQKGL